MNTRGRIGMRLRIDPASLSGELAFIESQMTVGVNRVWQLARSEPRADGRADDALVGAVSFGWNGPSAGDILPTERARIEERLRRVVAMSTRPAPLLQKYPVTTPGPLATSALALPPNSPWSSLDVEFHARLNELLNQLHNVKISDSSRSMVADLERRYAALLDSSVAALATIVEVRARCSWTPLLTEWLGRATSRFGSIVAYFYVWGEDRRERLIKLDAEHLAGAIPKLTDFGSRFPAGVDFTVEPGTRIVLVAFGMPEAELREKDLPGSVVITMLDSAPWFAVCEAGASRSAIAVELYDAELPDLIAPMVWGGSFRILPNLLRSGYRSLFDRLVQRRFDADISSIEAALFDEDDAYQHQGRFLEMVRDWAGLYDVRRSDGTSWFDAFLGRLAKDGWYRDYGVTKTSTTSYLDMLFSLFDDSEGELLGLVARRSERYGRYQPPDALLANPFAVNAPVNVALVTRVGDLVLKRLSAGVSAESSHYAVNVISALDARAQAAVLREIMSRYDERTWIGLGRYGERRPYAMLYWLFEALTSDDKRVLADSLVRNGVMNRATADALVDGRGFVAQLLPFTTDLAIESTEYWANEYVKSSDGTALLYGVMGGFSVLATPKVIDQTALVLGTAWMGNLVGPIMAARAPTLATVLTIGGSGLAAFNAGMALGQLDSGRDAQGRPLDDTSRVVLALTAFSNILFSVAGIASLQIPKTSPSPSPSPSPLLGRVLPGETSPIAAAEQMGNAAASGVHMKLVSFDPDTGEAVMAAQNMATGRYAMAKVNVRTGNGMVVGPEGETGSIANFRVVPSRAALPAGVNLPPPTAIVQSAPFVQPGTGATPTLSVPAGHLLLSGNNYRTLAQILPDPAGPFTEHSIELAYKSYVATLDASAQPAARDKWVKLTRFGPRANLINRLGPHFPAADGEPIFIRLSRVARPASLTDERLTTLKRLLDAKPAAVGARYDPLRAAGSMADEVNLGNFNILQGNIGEVLAGPVRQGIESSIRLRFPGSVVYDGVRITLPISGGTSTAPLLFSDGIIAQTIGPNLIVRGVVEIKSGSTGGQQATEQMFEWIEGRIEDGAKLILPDGRKFVYDPELKLRNSDGSRPPRVIFLQSAVRHVITAASTETLGTQSSMGIAPLVQRHALAATAQEIKYLTRIEAEARAAGATSKSAQPTDPLTGVDPFNPNSDDGSGP